MMLEKIDYDIIVVGAGPAGCFAAKTAVENGCDVLLVEKRPEIGAPKRCGEGLSLNGLKELGLKRDPKFIMNEIRGANCYAPSDKKVTVRYPDTIGFVLERKMFDKYLAIDAAKAGAKVLARTAATGLIKSDNYVKGIKVNRHGENFDLTCKVVIAADGVESKVARWAGIDSTNKLIDIDSGFQYEMVIDLDEPDMLDLFFGSNIAYRGYVWIFPKGKDIANVGVGVGGNAPKPARFYLDKFIKEHPKLKHGSIIEVNAGGIPVGNPLDKLVVNGLMVVGDAAHQVNAIHGGGIHEASIAGRIAGKVASECIKKGNVSEKRLKEYEKIWMEKRGKHLKKIVKLRQVIEKLNDDDLNMIAENITGGTLIELSKGKKFSFLAKILMKKPSLALLVKDLL